MKKFVGQELLMAWRFSFLTGRPVDVCYDGKPFSVRKKNKNYEKLVHTLLKKRLANDIFHKFTEIAHSMYTVGIKKLLMKIYVHTLVWKQRIL